MNIYFDFTRLYNKFIVGTRAQVTFPVSRFINKTAGSLLKLKSDYLFSVELDKILTCGFAIYSSLVWM